MCIDFQRRTEGSNESEQKSKQFEGESKIMIKPEMEYSTGDSVKFRLKSGEVQKGDVVFIEKKRRGNMVYINSSDRRAYRIPEKSIIARSRA